MAYSQLIPATTFRERLGLVLAFGALLALMVPFNDASSLGEHFLALRVNARVTVHGYNHGWPIVTLAHGASANRRFVMPLPAACSAYLRSNDSVYKAPGENAITVLRDSSRFRVRTVWASYRNPDLAQLVERQVVPK